jgi:hypothetical protein
MRRQLRSTSAVPFGTATCGRRSWIVCATTVLRPSIALRRACKMSYRRANIGP